TLDGEILRRQLAENDVQERDHRERQRERDTVHYRGRPHAERGEYRTDQRREGRLADPAESEAGERDPELSHREVAVEIAQDRLGGGGAAHARTGAFFDPRRAYLDDSELGHHEKCIQENEKNREE